MLISVTMCVSVCMRACVHVCVFVWVCACMRVCVIPSGGLHSTNMTELLKGYRQSPVEFTTNDCGGPGTPVTNSSVKVRLSHTCHGYSCNLHWCRWKLKHQIRNGHCHWQQRRRQWQVSKQSQPSILTHPTFTLNEQETLAMCHPTHTCMWNHDHEFLVLRW